MQQHLTLLKDVRGCMTRFDPLTPEIVAKETEDGLTFSELETILKDCGMDIQKVVYDGSRRLQNAYYADFEQGHYCWIPFQRKGLKEILRTISGNFSHPDFGKARRNREWEAFYLMDVPLPMQIYDFERRYLDINPEKVFSVWSCIHTRLDYANSMWDPEVLQYVFAHAPHTEMPPTDEDGMVTIYRGMGELSQPPETAISWTTNPACALWFANRSGRGTRLVSAKVRPEDILIFKPGYDAEEEVILKPGTNLQICETGMIPSTEDCVPRLLAPVTKDFFRFGSIAVTLGYTRATKAELEEEVLELHAARIFDNPLWVDFISFNERFRPEVLCAVKLISVMPECCKKEGFLTEARYLEGSSFQGENFCPHCGRWTKICLVDNKEIKGDDDYDQQEETH